MLFRGHSSYGELQCAFDADGEASGEVCELKVVLVVVAIQIGNAVTETEIYQKNFLSRKGFFSRSLDLTEEGGLVTKELICSTPTY